MTNNKMGGWHIAFKNTLLSLDNGALPFLNSLIEMEEVIMQKVIRLTNGEKMAKKKYLVLN
jgi:hypothetical protein